jgi:23S rRNA (uracil1939-C5)-methyltransferase
MRVPVCSVAERCGGCPLLGLSPEETRARKTGELRRALVCELGHKFETFPIDWCERVTSSSYRHRLRLKIHNDGQIGFFNQEKSIDCPVLETGLRDALPELTTFTQGRQSVLSELCHVEIRARDLDGKLGVCFYPRDTARFPSAELVEQLRQLGHDFLWTVAHEQATIPCQRHALLDLYHYVPLTSFLQVNRVVNDALVSNLVAGAHQRQLTSFCDLYAGAGNFTLPLLSLGMTGTAVEYDDRAMSACEHSANDQGFTKGQYVAGDAASCANQLVTEKQRFDLVIVDPPRAGARNAIATMAELTQSHLVYCSCNPASLARDLRALVALNMRIEHVTAYDMFAGTRHLETCVWLKKA